jgi:hypothetical protein
MMMMMMTTTDGLSDRGSSIKIDQEQELVPLVAESPNKQMI